MHLYNQGKLLLLIACLLGVLMVFVSDDWLNRFIGAAVATFFGIGTIRAYFDLPVHDYKTRNKKA